ncbi:MAG TPA: hypothetical protein VKQ72_17905 [Aggregatilineales bacterium]|nr:hypothetical protein [Aggregatilineales bacterium]
MLKLSILKLVVGIVSVLGVSQACILNDIFNGLLATDTQLAVKNQCLDTLTVKSVTGIPYGPVTVTWTPLDFNGDPGSFSVFYDYVDSKTYTTMFGNSFPQGTPFSLYDYEQGAAADATSLTFNVDHDQIKKAMATPGQFVVTVSADLGDLSCVAQKKIILNLNTEAKVVKITTTPPPAVTCAANQPPNAQGICPKPTPCNNQGYLLNGDGTCGQACPATHLRNNSNQCVCIQGYTDNGNSNGQCVPVSANQCTPILIAKCYAIIAKGCGPEICVSGQCQAPKACKP